MRTFLNRLKICFLFFLLCCSTDQIDQVTEPLLVVREAPTSSFLKAKAANRNFDRRLTYKPLGYGFFGT